MGIQPGKRERCKKLMPTTHRGIRIGMNKLHYIAKFIFGRTITNYIRLELKKSENFLHKIILIRFLRILNHDGSGSYMSDLSGNRGGGD
jgi:hypothetical protein